MNIGEDRGLSYVFLMPEADDEGEDLSPAISLRLYPGDTLSQARRFYPRVDASVRDRLIELDATQGWTVETNFHLGFRARGLLHDTSPVGLARYLDYWQAHIGEHRERPAGEWPAILNRLAADGIVSADYPHRFSEEVGRRAALHPRPGLVIKRVWPLPEVEQLDRDGGFASVVRRTTDHALNELGERPLRR